MNEWIPVIASIIGAFTATMAWMQARTAAVKVENVHLSLNSRLDALILSKVTIAKAEGKAEGIAEEKAKIAT